MNTQRKLLTLALLVGSLATWTVLAGGPGGTATASPGATPEPAPSQAPAPSADPEVLSGTLLIVENESWLLALAAPASAYAAPGTPWVLVAQVDSSQGSEVSALGPANCLTLSRVEPLDPALPTGCTKRSYLLGSDPAFASYRLAETLWKRSSQAVIARTDEPAGILQGASLAAQERAPLLLLAPNREQELERACAQLGVKTATFVSKTPAKLGGLVVRHLTPEATPLEVARRLRARGPVYALALAAIPQQGEKGPAWIGPLYSLARNAPLVLLPQPRRSRAQDPRPPPYGSLAAVSSACGPALRSLAILADEVQIPHGQLVASTGGSDGDDYEVRVEPGSLPPTRGTVPQVGVGRFPWASLPLCARVLLRSVARNRLVRGPPRAWVAANPRPRKAPLPLCEVVARTTAHELENHRVLVDRFFGTPVDLPRPQLALGKAQLVIFEGHSNDANLFPESAPGLQDPLREWLDSPMPFEHDPRDDEPEEAEPDWNEPIRARRVETEFWAALPPEPDEAPESDHPEQDSLEETDPPSDEVPLDPDPEEEAEIPQVQPQFMKGAPLVVFQSCNSLWFSDLALRFGAAGVIGSTTRIHSASGSAFAHALVQGLLWKGATVSEALRDARAFFLLVDDLKVLRGQQKRREARRVTWSFLYLGDPELRPLALSGRAPKRRGLALRPGARGGLKVKAPRRRLRATARGEYRMHAYPRSYTAGLVRRSKGESRARNLAPLHFFQAPALPEGSSPPRFRRRRAPGQTSKRRPGTVARVHPVTGKIYLLHFGPRLKLRAAYTLDARHGR